MLGDKAGSMTLQETSKPIDSGQYGLPAMETNTVGGGKLLGHDVQTQASFTAHMKPDGSWLGHAHAGVIFCAEGIATYKCDGVGGDDRSGPRRHDDDLRHARDGFRTISRRPLDFYGRW